MSTFFAVNRARQVEYEKFARISLARYNRGDQVPSSFFVASNRISLITIICKMSGQVETVACDVNVHKYRVYSADATTTPSRVIQHYRDMRTGQTLDFYHRMEQKYSFADGQYRAKMTIAEALEQLEDYVDASDPDMELPNKLHLLQTAQGIRQAGHPDWMQLVGLLHDMGKIMFLWGTSQDGQDGRSPQGKQWALGGDTFVVGCEIPDSVVYPEFNELNPDMEHPLYRTKFGIYRPHCGLDELKFAWGHDEYMYRMLVANKETCTLPQEGLDMIRYHSAYPLHEQNAYSHLLQPQDEERLAWVRLFNQFDLYTKDNHYDIRDKMETELWPYYVQILHKYGLGGTLKW
jgi:inositol oxygenase